MRLCIMDSSTSSSSLPSPSTSSSFSSSPSSANSASSSSSSYTVLNRQKPSCGQFAAYEACSHFLPFAAVSASCSPHQRYESASSTALSSSSLSAAAQAAFSPAPCCACPRAVAGDCRRLRSWERMARVDSLQLPGLYEKLVAVLERKVKAPCDFRETERERGESKREKEERGAEEREKTCHAKDETDKERDSRQEGEDERGDWQASRTGSGAGRLRRDGEEGEDVGEEKRNKKGEEMEKVNAGDRREEDQTEGRWEGKTEKEESTGTNGGRDTVGCSPEPATLDGNVRMEKEPKSRHYKETTVCELLLGSAVYNAIEMDVHRTFPSLPFFKEEGQTAMRRVLQAYAVFDPEVGYVQGMNFVVGTLLHHSNTCIHWNVGERRGVMSLLLNSPADGALSPRSRFLHSSSVGETGDSSTALRARGNERGGSRNGDAKAPEQDDVHFCIRTREGRVFWLLVAMFYLYDMRRLFLPSLPGVFEKCDRIERMMRIVLPDLAEHLSCSNVSLSLLTSDWLLTLFSYSVPLDVCTAVWTKFFQEGWVFIYKLVIARFKKVKRQMCNQTDLVELVKTAKFSAPQNALAAVGESVVSWLLANPRNSDRRGAGGDTQAVSYLTSLGLLLQQQLQKTPSQDALTSGLSVSNDPNASESKEMWRDIIEEASDLDVDRRLFLQVELEMLERERAHIREKAAAVETHETHRREAQEARSGEICKVERNCRSRLSQGETEGTVNNRGGAHEKHSNFLPGRGEEDRSPRRKTVGLWQPTKGEEREAKMSGGPTLERNDATVVVGEKKRVEEQSDEGEDNGKQSKHLKEKIRLGEQCWLDESSEPTNDVNESTSENNGKQSKHLKEKIRLGEQCLLDESSEPTNDVNESTSENARTVSTAPSTSDPAVGAVSPDGGTTSPLCHGKDEKKSSEVGGRDSAWFAFSPLLHVEKCLAFLRRAKEEDLRTETEELCAECFAHQKLLFHVAEQRQHLQQLALEALKKPKQVPEALRHWTAQGANFYEE